MVRRMIWRDLHEGVAWFVVISNAIVGLWALGAHWLEWLRRPWLWWSTAVAQVSLFVQAALGVAILQSEGIQPPELHVTYGFVTLVAVGLIYSYRQQVSQWLYLLYGFGGLFLMGMGIRGMILS